MKHSVKLETVPFHMICSFSLHTSFTVINHQKWVCWKWWTFVGACMAVLFFTGVSALKNSVFFPDLFCSLLDPSLESCEWFNGHPFALVKTLSSDVWAKWQGCPNASTPWQCSHWAFPGRLWTFSWCDGSNSRDFAGVLPQKMSIKRWILTTHSFQVLAFLQNLQNICVVFSSFLVPFASFVAFPNACSIHHNQLLQQPHCSIFMSPWRSAVLAVNESHIKALALMLTALLHFVACLPSDEMFLWWILCTLTNWWQNVENVGDSSMMSGGTANESDHQWHPHQDVCSEFKSPAFVQQTTFVMQQHQFGCENTENLPRQAIWAGLSRGWDGVHQKKRMCEDNIAEAHDARIWAWQTSETVNLADFEKSVRGIPVESSMRTRNVMFMPKNSRHHHDSLTENMPQFLKCKQEERETLRDHTQDSSRQGTSWKSVLGLVAHAICQVDKATQRGNKRLNCGRLIGEASLQVICNSCEHKCGWLRQELHERHSGKFDKCPIPLEAACDRLTEHLQRPEEEVHWKKELSCRKHCRSSEHWSEVEEHQSMLHACVSCESHCQCNDGRQRNRKKQMFGETGKGLLKQIQRPTNRSQHDCHQGLVQQFEE